jgi:hypothetical protein
LDGGVAIGFARRRLTGIPQAPLSSDDGFQGKPGWGAHVKFFLSSGLKLGMAAAAFLLASSCEAKPPKPKTEIDELMETVRKLYPEFYAQIGREVRAAGSDKAQARKAIGRMISYVQSTAMRHLRDADNALIREPRDMRVFELTEAAKEGPAVCARRAQGGAGAASLEDNASFGERQARLFNRLLLVKERELKTATREEVTADEKAFREAHPDLVKGMDASRKRGLAPEEAKKVCDATMAQWTYFRDLPEDRIGPVFRGYLATVRNWWW